MELHASTVTHTYTYVTNIQLNIMTNIHTHIQFTIYFVTTLSCTSTFISQDVIHSMIIFSIHKPNVLTIFMKVSLNVLGANVEAKPF